MSRMWFPGMDERHRVYKLVCKLASMTAEDTIPVEDVIDLAQAIKYIMEDIFAKDSLT